MRKSLWVQRNKGNNANAYENVNRYEFCKQ